jgi:hypothetical protein
VEGRAEASALVTDAELVAAMRAAGAVPEGPRETVLRMLAARSERAAEGYAARGWKAEAEREREVAEALRRAVVLAPQATLTSM